MISIASVYAHPLEFITLDSIPLMSSLLILKSRMHIITFTTWLIFRLIETKDAHAGFDFPFSMFKAIPLTTGSPFHNFHHLKNIGNYATFTRIWDHVFGTDKAYFESAAKMTKNE